MTLSEFQADFRAISVFSESRHDRWVDLHFRVLVDPAISNEKPPPDIPPF